MGNKPQYPTGVTVWPLGTPRPTSPPPPKRAGNAVDVTLEFYIQQNQKLIDALAGLWSYACTGASATDIDTNEQHQFVTARLLLEPLWSKNRKAALERQQRESNG